MSNGIEPTAGIQTVRRVRGLDGRHSSFQVTDYAYAQWRSRLASHADLPSTFVMGDRLLPRDHLLMQAALQPFVDGGISKTVVLARDTPLSSVDEMFRAAHALGLKGATVFRSCMRPGAGDRPPDLGALWGRAARDRCSRAEADGI